MDEKLNSHLKKHHGHDDLVGEHRWGDAGQIILLIIFLVIWILDSFVYNFLTFLSEYVPIVIRIVAGITVMAFSWSLARKGLKIVFSEKREKPEVIQKGVFSFVRHPIYLGAILLYLGFILITLSLASLAFWVLLVIPFYIFISKYEEKILTSYFGQGYLNYKDKVPMLLPKLFRRTRNLLI
jgi:protein-S-isoprenylcysteine O-methyltransferase Ste14